MQEIWELFETLERRPLATRPEKKVSHRQLPVTSVRH